MKTKIVSCHTADSKPVNQEVNGTVILPPLVFPALSIMGLFATLSINDIQHNAFSVIMPKKLNTACFPNCVQQKCFEMLTTGNTKGGRIIVLLTSCLTGLESAI